MKEDISKKNHFARVAVGRVNDINDRIRKLGDMSKRSYYEWEPDQVKVIFAAIRDELDQAEQMFAKAGKRFSLDDLKGESSDE